MSRATQCCLFLIYVSGPPVEKSLRALIVTVSEREEGGSINVKLFERHNSSNETLFSSSPIITQIL